MDLDLEGKVALVTGGSAGIGRATAVEFTRAGARVGITYYEHPEAADEAIEEITLAGGQGFAVRYDLSDDASIRQAVQLVLDHWGELEVLVNNAVDWGPAGSGISHTGKPFEDVTPEDWRRVIRANLEGPYLTIQAALPSLRAAGWGRIVNLSSNLAEAGIPGSGPYAAAKAGILGLTRVLASELAPAGILTNAVLPGLTVTERASRNIPQQALEGLAGRTPTGRLSTPEDVAPLIVFLGSGANTHINGELIRVAGGMR